MKKDNHCQDCGKLIWDVSIRCKSCAKKGILSPVFKGGEKARECFCEDCDKKLGYLAYYKNNKKCNKCEGIRKSQDREFSNILKKANKRTKTKHFCKDCKKEVGYGRKRCKECNGKYLSIKFIGIGNPNHKHGNGNDPYPLDFSDILKEQIRNRDNYKCQNCGMTEEEHLIVYGQVLHVHHIDYNKYNNEEDNLITACQQCNLRANHNRDYWKKYFKKILVEVL